MVIDFHTHTFPDKIADSAIEKLALAGNIKPYRRGTLDSLHESMAKSNIDISVVLPVATSPRQVSTINRLSAELNGKGGVYFAGAIHPDCEDVDGILDEIVGAGLRGIKLHPDYQEVSFSDRRYINIIRKAAERELWVVTHAGVDVAYPDDVHATPDGILYVLSELSDLSSFKLILAHMGGCDLPDEVLSKLCGKNVYFDTSFVLTRYPEKCLEIIKAHGADKIIFGSDSPWAHQGEYLEKLLSFPLSDEEKEKILYKNAAKLLHI